MRIIKSIQPFKLSQIDCDRIAMEMVNIYTGVEHYDIVNIKKISNPTNTKYLTIQKNGTEYEYIPANGHITLNYHCKMYDRDSLISLLKRKFTLYVRGLERETTFRYHQDGTGQFTLEEVEGHRDDFFDIRTSLPNKKTNLSNLNFIWFLTTQDVRLHILYEYPGLIQKKEDLINSISTIYIDMAHDDFEKTITNGFPRAIGKPSLETKINLVDFMFYFAKDSNVGFDFTLATCHATIYTFDKPKVYVYTYKKEQHPNLKFYKNWEEPIKLPKPLDELTKCSQCNGHLLQDHYIIIAVKNPSYGNKICAFCAHTKHDYTGKMIFRVFEPTFPTKESYMNRLESPNQKKLFKELDTWKTQVKYFSNGYDNKPKKKIDNFVKPEFVKLGLDKLPQISSFITLDLKNGNPNFMYLGICSGAWENIKRILYIFIDGVTLFSYREININNRW